jgi:hypothetical protein
MQGSATPVKYQQDVRCKQCGRLVDRLELCAGSERDERLKGWIVQESWRRHVRSNPQCVGAGVRYGELVKKEA